jgi:hypothetical protein
MLKQVLRLNSIPIKRFTITGGGGRLKLRLMMTNKKDIKLDDKEVERQAKLAI